MIIVYLFSWNLQKIGKIQKRGFDSSNALIQLHWCEQFIIFKLAIYYSSMILSFPVVNIRRQLGPWLQSIDYNLLHYSYRCFHSSQLACFLRFFGEEWNYRRQEKWSSYLCSLPVVLPSSKNVAEYIRINRSFARYIQIRSFFFSSSFKGKE
jgi:hypothetical protein